MQERDYKDTLNLPDTKFPMKANLPQREPEMLKFWESGKVYERMASAGKAKPSFILHDGPPYANGHIHIGHALNKILKDIIVKYKSMRGFYSPYVPGWDCHGLPIELEVDKKLGRDKDGVSIPGKRKTCRDYAQKFVDIQRDEFKRLGVFGAWEKPYLTMTSDYEADIAAELMDFYMKGYAYKGKKPVHWCPSCVTALAEAEVEYGDKESPSVFVKFRINPEHLKKLGLENNAAHFVIWTTTPWTLPANLALAVNPDIEYAAVKDAGGDVLVVASGLIDKLKNDGVLTSTDAIKRYIGQDLIGMTAKHPFIDRASRVIGAGFVSVEEGTGIVHIAPGHGEDDYEAGLKEGLEILAPVDKFGKFERSGVAEIDGEFVFKANPKIIDILQNKGALIAQKSIAHSYPHCWRCKKPVIFRATEQWFISMSHEGLRDKCLSEIDKVQWVPVWGRDRIQGMLKSRPDWCISRQRAWGVPITVFKCKSCGQYIKDKSVNDRVIEIFRADSSDAWFSMAAQDILPAGYKCPKCGHAEFDKEMDILDVWFDSGVSHAVTLKPERGLSWPADMYLEGSDQHRGWFQSSMLASVGTRGSAPYKIVLTHGFVVDGKGKKMSKSIGNVVAPQDIIKSTGAEILRLWVSAEDYKGDIRISKEIMDRLTEAYRKIRNTAKYLLGNIDDYPGGDYRPHLTEMDRWAMSRLQGLIERVTLSYEKFNFHEVYHALYNFCVVDMSSFYLDILKDRLYTFRRDSNERRAAQWVLNEILTAMTKLMAPVLSFTAEEIWQHMKAKRADSVFLSDFPVADKGLTDMELESKWERIIAIRNEVNKALELKRAAKFIGNSLEAGVSLYLSDDDRVLMRPYLDMLATLFIVSEAGISDSGEGEYKSEAVKGMSVDIKRASGQKCPRCWNYSTTVGAHGDMPELCSRCYGNVK